MNTYVGLGDLTPKEPVLLEAPFGLLEASER